MKFDVDYNKRLVEKYPFLMPSDYISDETPEDYDYSYTLLDDVEEGWRTAFGEQLCEEIMHALVRDDAVSGYKIFQIKEKFGELRWYDNLRLVNDNGDDIIDKYSAISRKTCVSCGKPAKKISRGWICPYCNECFEKFYPDATTHDYVLVEDAFGIEEE